MNVDADGFHLDLDLRGMFEALHPIQFHAFARRDSRWEVQTLLTGEGWYSLYVRDRAGTCKLVVVCVIIADVVPCDLPDLRYAAFAAVKCSPQLLEGVRTWLAASSLPLNDGACVWDELDADGYATRMACASAGAAGSVRYAAECRGALVECSGTPGLRALIVDIGVDPGALLDESARHRPLSRPVADFDVVMDFRMRDVHALDALMAEVGSRIGFEHVGHLRASSLALSYHTGRSSIS